MPASLLQNYYCIVSKKYSSDYELLIIKGTNAQRMQIQLKSRGYRVLICLSKKSLLKLQSQSQNDYYIYRPNWSDKAYDFIQSIKPLEVDN